MKVSSRVKKIKFWFKKRFIHELRRGEGLKVVNKLNNRELKIGES